MSTANAGRGHYYAHSLESEPEAAWEPLFTPFGTADPNDATKGCSGANGEPCVHCEGLSPSHGHLNKVGWWAAAFAAAMFPPRSSQANAARAWCYLAGLWHDLGKFSDAFQGRLRGLAPRVDHSTAGAQHAAASIPAAGVLLSYAIAGHHAGLADALRNQSRSDLIERLRDTSISDWSQAPDGLTAWPPPPPPPCRRDPAEIAFFTRLTFSALVDADFLATEAFMQPRQAASRPTWPDDLLSRMVFG